MGAARRRVGIARIVASAACAGVLEVACSSFEEPVASGLDAAGSDAEATDAEATDAAATPDAPTPFDANAGPPCAVGACRIVFVTSETFPANFGGLDKADNECMTLAQASPALAGRSFRAWLSAPDAGANGRHTPGGTPYRRVDGVVVADDWNQLTSAASNVPALKAPIQITEKGDSTGAALVWTGTTYNGFPSGNTCAGWTSTAGGIAGQTGRTDRTDEAWTDTDESFPPTTDCAKIARFYCFEQ